MDPEEKRLVKRVERARAAGKLDNLEIHCRRLAEYRASVGRYEDALRAYQEELSVCETKNDAAGIATAHRMVGEMYSMLGKFSESLTHVNLYLDHARRTKNTVEEQRALATIGRTYFCWAAELKSSNNVGDAVKAEEVLKQCRKSYMKSLYICEEGLKDIDRKEQQEMKARILFNLGLACEIEEDVAKALDYVSKSITICKDQLLWEDLYRCLMSKASLLFKQSETSAALSAIDQACETAKKLGNCVELSVLALSQKGEFFLTMGNFLGARNALKKAYKLNSPNAEDKKTVEGLLKRAMLVVELENKLKTVEEKTLEEKKSLYEKFGDACCGVKHFKRAIQAYLNMLDCAVSLGQTGKELLPCYVSLYQTYIDNKEYDAALEYALKELEISKTVAKEAAKSHLVIAEIKELKRLSYHEIHQHYTTALNLVQNDVPLKASVLKRLASLQIADGREREAKETEEMLRQLDYESGDSDVEQDELPEVHLSDLSDSDEETVRRSVKNSFKLTRNEKGETPLHVAAIKGDLARAQRLLYLGHPVKERDIAGWTPLHEAANHGHVEMVRLLLKSGANVNDRGGKECGGVTPLHDAASCGHFDVMSVLLEHNASATVLTDNNETPLDCLKAWRKRVGQLSEEDDETYEKFLKVLQERLTAAGFQPEPKKTEKRRRWPSASPPPSDVSMDSPPPKCRPVRDYRAAIEALRKRPLSVECSSKPVAKNPLLDETSYVQEWLDDDLKHVQKKKKRNELTEPRNRIDDDTIQFSDDDDDEPPIRRQSSLLDAGFTTEPIVVEDVDKSLEYPSMPSPPLSSSSAPYLTKVRVTVDSVVLLIYIESNKQKELTVQWLAEEAARRFYEIEGRQPMLQLQTIDGAIFSPLDPVCVVLGEDLKGIVKGWKSTSLVERYKNSLEKTATGNNDCLGYGSYIQGPDQSILQRIAECDATGRLDLENLSLTEEELVPIFRIFSPDSGQITWLNLSGNALNDSGLTKLASYLTNSSIQHLNLSCTNITKKGLDSFLQTENLLNALRSLNVSFNPIGSYTFPRNFKQLSEFKIDYSESEFLY